MMMIPSNHCEYNQTREEIEHLLKCRLSPQHHFPQRRQFSLERIHLLEELLLVGRIVHYFRKQPLDEWVLHQVGHLQLLHRKRLRGSKWLGQYVVRL